MVKITAYNQEGEETTEVLLPKEVFEVKMNPDLIHQIIVSQLSNQRQVIASTKTRSEVSGGGRKPWRQKGTGRARHGSTRSPLWRHGGITFGPRNKVVFKREIPEKMRKTALFIALSDKVKDNLLIVLDDLKLEKTKTKIMAGILNKLPLKGKTALIVLPKMEKSLISASRNIPGIGTTQAKDLNCLDVLSYKYLILLKDSIKVIKEILCK
ncbi:MAG: 50S ribosomal protein L4 [Patescibacteria group bacterium]